MKSVWSKTGVLSRDADIALLVFSLLLVCYLITYTGVIQSSDGLAMFSTAESLVRNGSGDSNQLLWMGLQQASFGRDGDLYSRKGLGTTLLILPLVWLAQRWPALGLVQAALLLNPLLTAWTGALIYAAARRLGWRPAVALVTALTFGLLTLAWPYTQDLFSEPMTGWSMFAALYGLLSFRQTGRRAYLWAAGSAWGLGYLARTLNIITLPLFALGLAAVLWQSGQTTQALAARHDAGQTASAFIARQWSSRRAWISFAAPIAVAGALSLLWNWLRYGSILDTGYLEVESFSGVWWFGIWGLLAGPARGLIWYSPALLLGLAGWRWFRVHHGWLVGVILGTSLLYGLVYGKWFMWHGGYSWGPRFLVPLMPGLALLTGPAWDQFSGRWRLPGRMLTGLAVGASLLVNLLGAVVPYGLAQNWLADAVHPLFATETFTRLAYSPLLLQWRFLSSQHVAFAWWHSGPDWVSLGLLSALAVGGTWALVRLVRTDRSHGPRWLAPLIVAAVGIAIVLVCVRSQTALSGAANRAVAAHIRDLEQPGDAVLHLKPEETQQFANAYHGGLPTYGLPPVGSLGPSEEAWLSRMQRDQRRLWLVSAPTPADRSGWERALRSKSFLVEEADLGPTDDARRLVLYSFSAAGTQPWLASNAKVNFTDAAAKPGLIRLNSYGFTSRAEPGGELLLALRWEALRPVGQRYKVFVHLHDGAGKSVAQSDREPVAWLRPTDSWQPSEEIADRYGFLLPGDLAPGHYTLSVGLYDPATGKRLAAEGPAGDAITIGPVEVTAAN